MKTAIYPGSFDPLTNGHVSIIQGGLVAFDRVIIGVLNNAKKKSAFSVDERIEMIHESIEHVGLPTDRLEVDSFDGLLVEYAQKKNVSVLLRGLRAVSDFEFELQMASMNRHLSDEIETVFIMAKEKYFYVASNLVKEIASLGGNVDDLVPDPVAARLRKR